MTLMFHLPVPPSVNGLYFNLPNKGRAKTKAYTKWVREADKWYTLQGLGKLKPIIGPAELTIKLPSIRGDASNRIKICEDWLVSRGLTSDDKNNRKVTVEIDPALTDCLVEVRAA